MRAIGIIDRTGKVLPKVERVAGSASVVDLGPLTELGPASARVDVLVLGPLDLTDTALHRVERYTRRHPAAAVVAVGVEHGVPGAPFRRQGVVALSRGKPTPAKVARLLGKADEARGLMAAELGLATQPAHQPPAPAYDDDVIDLTEVTASRSVDHGLLITVASATGGCGKTFFATNLATSIARAGKRVLLVDLDLQFGEVAPVLRIRHRYSVYDGLYGPDTRPLPPDALEEQLDDLVFHHELGFDVLVAPREPSFADYVGARDAARVLDAVLPRYDAVIVDTPPALNEVVLVALDRSDVVPVLATLDVPSLKNLTVFLDALRRLRVDDSTVRLVLNKVERDIGIEVKQAQEAFNDRFVASIPLARNVSRSINAGDPVVHREPRTPVARALEAAVQATYPEPLEYPAEDAARDWRFRRLLDWRLTSSPEKETA